MDKISILRTIEIPIWIMDVDRARMAWGNKHALQHWNSPSLEEFCSRDLSKDMSSTVRIRLQQYLLDCAASDENLYEDWTIYPNDVPKTYRVALRNYVLEDGRDALCLQILNHQIEETPCALHSMQALLHTPTMVSVFNSDLSLIYANPAARKIFPVNQISLFGYLAHASDLDSILNHLKSKDSYETDMQVNTNTGIRWHAMTIQICPDPVSANRTYLISATDIPGKGIGQRGKAYHTVTDTLTGLPNRTALVEKIQNRIDAHKVKSFAVLFLNLNRFKLVNDTLGYSVGDSLLRETAIFLQTLVGTNSVVARLSGDEFVLILDNADYPFIEKNIQAILRLSQSPMTIDGYNLRVCPSVGVSIYPRDGQTTTKLMQRADIAVDAAKSQGTTGYQYFNCSLGKAVREKLELEADMAQAILSNEFELYYQPKVNATNLEVIELEALIRWQHPTKGLISPLKFIPIAEETGMILEIGDWVINQALADQIKWQTLGHHVSVAVNVSPKQFLSPDFIYRVRDSIEHSGSEPGILNLEVTESSLIGDEENVQFILNQLSDGGIKLSIDDFGTGYSNLANLHKYPIDCLKIDRAFLNNADKSLLKTILNMGKILEMTVVAEGVETIEQIQWLRQHHCDQLQGFYISKPVPYDETIVFLKQSAQTGPKSAMAA